MTTSSDQASGSAGQGGIQTREASGSEAQKGKEKESQLGPGPDEEDEEIQDLEELIEASADKVGKEKLGKIKRKLAEMREALQAKREAQKKDTRRATSAHPSTRGGSPGSDDEDLGQIETFVGGEGPAAKKQRRTAEEKETQAALAAIVRDTTVKQRITQGKRARVTTNASPADEAAVLNASSRFLNFTVPPTLHSRLHWHDHLIPLIFLTNEDLAELQNPNSPLSKVLAKHDQVLDPTLDYVLSHADWATAFKRYIELWTDPRYLCDDEIESIDDMRTAWFGHLENVENLLDSAEDDFDRRIAIGYDISIRKLLHTTEASFNPGKMYPTVLEKVRNQVLKDRLEPSKSPNLAFGKHKETSTLLPSLAETILKKKDDHASSSGGTNGTQSFRDRDRQPFRFLDSNNRKPPCCFGCGVVGHPLGECRNVGPANVKNVDGRVKLTSLVVVEDFRDLLGTTVRATRSAARSSSAAATSASAARAGNTSARFAGQTDTERAVTPTLLATPPAPDAAEAAGRTGLAPGDRANPSTSPLLQVTTPFHASRWNEGLDRLSPSAQWRYRIVREGLSGGFPIGIGAGTSLSTSRVVEPKERYDAETRSRIVKYLYGELEANRVAGPLAKEKVEEILGSPFQTSPFKLVEKSGSTKKRFVRDFSAPRNDSTTPSINERIRKDANPPYLLRNNWHLFPHTARLVLSLLPTARALVVDVQDGFRTVPVRPEDRRWLVMNLDNGFFIDKCLPMGFVTATDAFGLAMDALGEILEYEWAEFGMRWISWVDDIPLAFERRLGDSWDSTNRLALERLDFYGVPVADEKVKKIDADVSTFDFVGFRWDIQNKTVELLEAKREKFLAQVEELATDTLMIDLRTLESVTGRLHYVAHIVPQGHLRLISLNAFKASFGDNYLIRKHPSGSLATKPSRPYEGVVGELRWWATVLRLEHPLFRRLLAPIRSSKRILEVEISSDACDEGIGAIAGGYFSYIKLKAGWKTADARRNIDYAEALGVELALAFLSEMAASTSDEELRDFRIVAFCDNSSVTDGWAARKHANSHVNRVLTRLVEWCQLHDCDLDIPWILSQENDSDAISRGVIPTDRELVLPDLASFPGLQADLSTISNFA